MQLSVVHTNFHSTEGHFVLPFVFQVRRLEDTDRDSYGLEKVIAHVPGA